jgi:glutamate N-acetyltransferase/amino-acid N-acetyltransferase
MVAPDMATVISCVLTDAPLSGQACAQIWKEAVDASLNCVTVDGDTSTNDTAVLMAAGEGLSDSSGNAEGDVLAIGSDGYGLVKDAIKAVSIELARSIARDGEGATKLVTVAVTGAPCDKDARKIALAIGNSPLVKTALFGCDANWGRVAGAAGRAGVPFDQGRLAITFAGVKVCEGGTAISFNEDEAFLALSKPEVEVQVDLGAGLGQARIWTCDFSYDYVKINGEYRS